MANNQTQPNKLWIVGGVGAVLVGASVWGITAHYRNADATPVLPRELTVEGLKEQRAEPGKMRDTMREAMDREDLTDEQKRQIAQNMREVWRSTMRERVDEYFNASEDDRVAVLDRQIDEFQRFREEMERRRADQERAGQAKEGDKARPEREERWRGAMESQSKEERKERSESRNPDEMGRTMAYFGAMRQRMTERGIKPPEGGPGRGGRGFFGGP